MSGEMGQFTDGDDVITKGPSTSYVQADVTVGTSAVEAKVGGSRLANRKRLIITNKSNVTIYIGPSGVTTTTGRPLLKDQQMFTDDGDIGVYMIAGSSSNTVGVEEKS